MTALITGKRGSVTARPTVEPIKSIKRYATRKPVVTGSWECSSLGDPNDPLRGGSVLRAGRQRDGRRAPALGDGGVDRARHAGERVCSGRFAWDLVRERQGRSSP